MYPQSTQVSMAPSVSGVHHRLRGAISTAEGPLERSIGGPVGTMQGSTSMIGSGLGGYHSIGSSKPSVDEGSPELLSHDMSVSALYLHDLQSRKQRGLGQMGYENIEEMRAKNLWQRQDSNQGPVHAGMPNIQEKREEEEKDSENTETIAKSV
eukprot:XP_011432146.2 PREDICTED: uncharacterized protein LOC105331580 [Crassostrea gigas]